MLGSRKNNALLRSFCGASRSETTYRNYGQRDHSNWIYDVVSWRYASHSVFARLAPYAVCSIFLASQKSIYDNEVIKEGLEITDANTVIKAM
jgi:hypothetical protein